MPSQRNQVITWYPGIVTSGMVARYMGANNTGQGHSATATVWKDLVGHADATLTTTLRPGTRQWGLNYFESLKVSVAHFTWVTDPLPPEFSPEKCTFQVVFMPYAGADGANGGDLIGVDYISTMPFVSVAQQMAAMNGESLFEESSVFTKTFIRPLTANVIYDLTLTAYPYSAIPASNGQKQVWYGGTIAYNAPRLANFYVQLPQHRIAMGGNPAFVAINQIFFGRIYEARIYNRVLLPQEIAHNVAVDQQAYGFGP